MTRVGRPLVSVAWSVTCAIVLSWPTVGAGQGTSRGTIKGHVRIVGKIPGNPIIRMRADPMCAKIYGGKRTVQHDLRLAARQPRASFGRGDAEPDRRDR